MQQLYQWFRGWASRFRSIGSAPGPTRTVRTEVTVQRQSRTVLVGGAAVFNACPLCGQLLAPAQAEQARLRLQQGSIDMDPADRDTTDEF